MELVLSYIESLAFWRAQRIVNNPILMSRNPILRDVYPSLEYHERVIRTELSPYRSLPQISFSECACIPLAEIKNYIAHKFEPLALCEDVLNRARNLSEYNISSMLALNAYSRTACEHTRTHAGSSAVRAGRLDYERLYAVNFVPDISDTSTLHFMVPRSQRGLRQTNKQITYINAHLPHGSLYKVFIRADERHSFDLPESLSLYILSPELVVLFAAQKLRALCLENLCSMPRCPQRARGKLLFTHNIISLVNELCGSYGRDPLTATGVTYGLEPLTSVQKIRRFAEKMKRIHGCGNLLAALDCCFDNLASPFEVVVASALMLPAAMGGINFPTLEINQTRKLTSDNLLTPHHQRITPDLSSKKHKLIIECNGLEFHRSDEAIKEDHRRLRDYVSHNERHIPLTISDIKNPLVLSHTLEEIVAACHDTLGASKAFYLRQVIHNAKYQKARQIMLDLHIL